MSAAASHLRHEAESLAARLPPLLVEAERIAMTVSQGVHGRRRPGQGEAFWQFRRYQWGDAAAAIDWRQSAKSDPLYVREREWEAAQSVWLWRDGSASMDYRSHSRLSTKRRRASVLALALAVLLTRGGERIAVFGFPGSRVSVDRLAAILDNGSDSGNLPPAEIPPRHARVVMIGDFLVAPDDVAVALRGLAGNGVRGHMLQVLDPAEETLPFAGRIRFEDPENHDNLLLGRVESARDDYRALMAAHRDALATAAGRYGWSFETHRTDRPPQTALLGLYMALAGPGVD